MYKSVNAYKSHVPKDRDRVYKITEEELFMLGVIKLVRPRFNLVDGRELKNYKGYKGYNRRYGQYVGNLGVMMYYLQWQNEVKWKYYDRLLVGKRANKEVLSGEELLSIKQEILPLLNEDTQRKLLHNRSIIR